MNMIKVKNLKKQFQIGSETVNAIKDISFKGSTSIINAINENGDAFLKIQNISSNISQSLSVGDLINIEFNTEFGSIFTE